jgi:hypothetical protein
MATEKHKQESASEYLCGVRVGERVRLLQELVIRDERGRPTSEVHSPGEIWTVLPPSSDMPWRIWLREPSGDGHAWQDSKTKFWSWFERVDDNAA